MPKRTVTVFGIICLLVGLLGFFVPNVLYLVQFDLLQSLIYTVIGAVGLKFGLGRTPDIFRRYYLDAVAILYLGLLMLGLSFPNLGDIIHLEVPEHVFHALMGVSAALASDYYRKKITSHARPA